MHDHRRNFFFILFCFLCIFLIFFFRLGFSAHAFHSFVLPSFFHISRGYGDGFSMIMMILIKCFFFLFANLCIRTYSELAREKTWSRIHLVPLLLAESDRDGYRRQQAAIEREREIMKDVKGWEVRHWISIFSFPSIFVCLLFFFPSIYYFGSGRLLHFLFCLCLCSLPPSPPLSNLPAFASFFISSFLMERRERPGMIMDHGTE
jgi:hypothetical protein